MKKSTQAPGINRYQWVFMLVLSLVLVVLAFAFQEKLSEFRSLGLLGIFLVNLIGSATLFLPAPAIASVVAGAVIYPALAVALVASLGAGLGDMVGFLLGRSSKELLLRSQNRMYLLVQDVFRRYGGVAVMVIAFIPNPFFDAIGIVAGVFSYSPYKFFFWTFLGRFLRNILLAMIGAQL